MREDHYAHIGHMDSATVYFDANGLASLPQVVRRWPGVAGYLVVPVGTCAVLTLHNGRRKVYTEGMYFLKELPWGRYSVQFVDVRRHRTPIPFTESLCADGWRGGLAIEVSWRVCDAALIVDAVDPLGDLVTTAQASVRAVIESISHDELLGGVPDQAMDADAIAQAVRIRLQHNPAIQGLEIMGILVTDRQGDERRIKIVQETTVEQTRLTEQQRLLSERMELEQESRELKLFEAETKRKQMEEECKVRIREAEIEAAVAARLLPAKWHEIQLELAAGACRQRYELMGRAVDAYAQILGEAAKAAPPLESWGISSRRRPELGFESRDATLSQGLASLQTLLLQPPPVPAPGHVPLYSQPSALLARLVAEVAEIDQLDVVQTWHIEPNESKGFKVGIHCRNIALDIVCHPGYPSERPDVIVSDNGHGPVEIPWAEEMSLKDIILEVVARSEHSPSHSDKAE